jgi:hypothetical protein
MVNLLDPEKEKKVNSDNTLKYNQLGSGLCDRWVYTDMDYNFNCYNFDGEICDVKIWKCVMKKKEVREKMWSFDKNDKNLLSYWWFTKKGKDLKGANDLQIHNVPIIEYIP